MAAYYNEIDPFAAAWLRELIKEKLIADGEVDDRSIELVQPGDLRGFVQCHFFAGIGGWSYALRLAGWPDEREAWTGSCPCQPWSVAGKGEGTDDSRDLWPTWSELIRERRPAIVFGEQVASSDGMFFLDRVFADLEASSYAVGAADLAAASVSAPHKRQRLYFVADASGARRQQDTTGTSCDEGTNGRQSDGNYISHGASKSRDARMADTASERARRLPVRQRRSRQTQADADCNGEVSRLADANGYHEHWWSGPLQVGWNTIEAEIERGGRRYRAQWRLKPGLPLLAPGIPDRVERLCGFGNAIVPQVAQVFIESYLDCERGVA